MRSLCFAVAIFFVSQVATASQLLQDVSSLGDGAACTNLVESVKSQLQFEIIDVPAQHTAGQRYAGTLRLTKDFILSTDDWEQAYSFSAIRLTIKTPYPHIFNTTTQPNLVQFFFGNERDTTWCSKYRALSNQANSTFSTSIEATNTVILRAL